MNKNELHYYAIIPSKILIDKNITPNAKLLYGIISSLTNISGRCFASDNYFAEIFDVSKVSIQNWLRELENAEYISRNLFYKGDSKEIDHRDIILNGLMDSQTNKDNSIHEIKTTGIQENLTTGIQENLVDNNKDNNNISISKDIGEYKDSPSYKSNNKSNISNDNKSLAKKISLDDLENMTYLDIELNFSKTQNQKILLDYINKAINSKKIIGELTEWLQLSYLHKRPLYLSGLINQLELLNGFTEEEIISIIKNCTLADKSTFKYEIEKREREKKYQNNRDSNKPRVSEQKRTIKLGTECF